MFLLSTVINSLSLVYAGELHVSDHHLLKPVPVAKGDGSPILESQTDNKSYFTAWT